MAEPLEWSEKMERLFGRQIAVPVVNDPRTDLSQDILLGYPFAVIRNEVIKEGLADFSVGHDDGKHGSLTPSEKALLFCFVNMKAHFFSSVAVYHEQRRNLEKLGDDRLLLVDIGCGPSTAGLAFAEALPGQKFDYIGVDSAPAMQAQAIELWRAAHALGLVKQPIKTYFADNWLAIKNHPFGANNAVLLVFSYFFASHSLKTGDVVNLATTVKKMKAHRPSKPVAIIHINSPRPQANRHYHAFRKLLGFDSKEAGLIRVQSRQ